MVREPIRRLFVVVLVLVALACVGIGGGPRAVASPAAQDQSVDFEWRLLINPPAITLPSAAPSTVVVTGFSLRNNTAAITTYQLEVTGLPRGWRAEVSTPRVTLTAAGTTGATLTGISVLLTIPAGTVTGNQSITVSAFKLDGTGQRVARADVFVPLALAVGSPVATAELPPGCPEVNDPGNNAAGARLVLVDLEEAHGICQTGDEDWFKFAAVGGKIYTVDVPQMDIGLDLYLELFDANGVRLADNDDYFNRDLASPMPTDKRPRIQSWRSPRDGIYIVRVRDTLGVGGRNLTYRFVVRGESFGPTPTTVPELCNDPFEPDGLPEIARLILSNETQARRLCPDGDADWARFFAIAGRLYVIYTDTRPYAARPDEPLTYPAPGVDTVLLVADRDGRRLIDLNNDIPGGDSLDSEIQFRPVVDGFYYIQVKNVGELGNQFIRYDLTVRACPGQYCRPNPPRATAIAATPAPAAAPAAVPAPVITFP